MFLRNIKIHWVALLLSIAVGGIYASHHFFIPFFFLDSRFEIYEPLAGDYGDEVLLYGPRAHDAFVDFGIRGDFSLVEYPRSPALLPMLNPLLLGGLGKIFGSMNRGIIVSDILFPSLIFLLLYLVMCEIGVSRLGSLVFAMFYTTSPHFGISIPPISSFHLENLRRIVFPFFTQKEALYFSHFDEPKLTFLFLLVFLYMMMRALKRQSRNDIILAGVSFGILFYTYFYDWATMITSLGLMAVYFLATKDYRRFKIVGAITAIGICVSSYYWINVLAVRNLPTGHDVIARLGGEFSHQLRFATAWKSYIRAIGLVVFLWFFARTHMKETVIVMSAMLLSYIVVVNAQVITGFNIQPDHWYRVQFLPIAITVFVFFYMLYKRYEPHVIEKYASIACIGFFIYFFCSTLAGQYAYSRDNAYLFSTPVEYQESFEWLNHNTKIGSVVGTLSFGANLHLQMRTVNHIFTPFGLSTIASEDELWNRFMIMARLWGVDGKRFASLINQEGGAYYLFGDQYGLHTFDAAFFPYNWRVPRDALEKRITIYERMLTKKDILLSDYRLDYFFVDRNEFPQWKEPRELIPSIANVFDNGRVAIYSLR